MSSWRLVIIFSDRNSVDPDQMPLSALSDQGLDSLPVCKCLV